MSCNLVESWYHLFREELDAHNGSHLTELEVNKLGVKDSGALTVGIYCYIDGNLLPLLSLQQLSISVLWKVV